MRFFRVDDDVYISGRWFLAYPKDHLDEWVDPASFEDGAVVAAPGPLKIGVFQQGTPLDLTFAEQLLPTANARTAELLTRLAPEELQTIPISVEGRSEPYWILNATVALDCIDEDSSMFKLRLDPSKIGNHRFFRVKRWLHALIVSEDIKRGLEAAKIAGPRFVPV